MIYDPIIVRALLGRIDLGKLAEERQKLCNCNEDGHILHGHCPFCPAEHTFIVDQSRGVFHCTSCNAKGTALQYLMLLNGLEYSAAVAQLAARCGVTLAPTTEVPQ